ncbi:hypothetical protein Micbo1qcDRAFT_195879 [Microdochium bolleyi]|uniref:25S rRNA (Uridine(2843)-N(3))-methyltransferase n=1 Tax=Microdochium bolleyi TaxID=196109 RepID=A0A136J1P1_9PEZI|nr:hypothetical protein Micbo1qcDRAFT_195879 [Microdochium bolleyi]
MASKASPAASQQRRIKNTASKQIRNRSRRQRTEKAADDDAGSDDDLDGGGTVDDDALIEQRHQQRLLDIFRDSFRPALEHESFSTVLQEIKQALYERDFERAFGEPRHLEVYAARWSPTRALCYARILDEMRDELEQMTQSTSDDDIRSEHSDTAEGDLAEGVQEPDIKEADQTLEDQPEPRPSCPLQVLAIGGGAAEIVAFGSYMSQLPSDQSGHITLLDVGPWGEVVQTLHAHVTTPPVLSKYANAAAKAANAALVAPPEKFTSSFVQRDILDVGSSAEDLRGLLSSPGPATEPETAGAVVSTATGSPRTAAAQPILITLLFTLNELYTTSGIGKTTKFLRNLTAVAAPGTLLLVVDSPGSYSEASVGKEGAKKKYPMQWLLEHTLLESQRDAEKRRAAAARRRKAQEKGDEQGAAEGQSQDSVEGQGRQPAGEEKEDENTEAAVTAGGVAWEKVEAHSHDSVWFRMPENLRYPIALENMRYQMHVYRAV